jgi:hypothetical protein
MEEPLKVTGRLWCEVPLNVNDNVDAAERVIDVWVPPLLPSVTVTKFAITVCAAKFRFEESGREVKAG